MGWATLHEHWAAEELPVSVREACSVLYIVAVDVTEEVLDNFERLLEEPLSADGEKLPTESSDE